MRTICQSLIFGLLVVAFSCDTDASLNHPDENHFLKFYGNKGNQFGVDFVVNSDGTYILLGNSREKVDTTQQVYIAKADSKGKIVWEKTFGGPLDEEAKDIELLANGNLMVLANSEVTSGVNRNRDVMLLVLNQDGQILTSVLQGLNSASGVRDENACSITVINNGYIIAGSTSIIPVPPVDKSDFMYMRFRNDLTLVRETDPEAWNNRPVFGFPGEDVAVKVIQPNPSTFYIMGHTNADRTNTNNISDFNYYVTSLNDRGVIASNNLFLGSASDEKLNSVSLSPPQSGSGYFLSGISQNADDADVYTVKLIQQLTFSSSDESFSTFINLNPRKAPFQRAFNFSSLTNGYFVASEEFLLNSTSTSIILSKRDNRGNEIFTRTFGGKIGDDLSGSVQELPDGNIGMIGTMTLSGVADGQKKIVFMKLNPAGRLAP
jgi:hypothetical protein